jgi:hypothetical protein
MEDGSWQLAVGSWQLAIKKLRTSDFGLWTLNKLTKNSE